MTTTHILGDNVPRKSNFDPDLAKKLTKYYEEHPEELKDGPKLENPPSPILPSVTSIDNFIVIKNIRCVDADGNIFEHYDELHIAKDVVRRVDGAYQSFTPYQAIVHFEQQGLFLPSFALSCNIVATLFKASGEQKGTEYVVKDPELKKVLDQYKDHGGAGFGFHAQNTIVNRDDKNIIHYPRGEDFPQDDGSNNINQSRPIVRLRIPAGIGDDMTLADALRNAEATRYVRNLTGLEDPSVLVQVGEYFEKITSLWPHLDFETQSTWLGCDDEFSLIASSDLYDYNAARGVRKK